MLHQKSTGRPAAALDLAFRNLASERSRWLAGSVALGVAAMLVVFMQGVVRWLDDSATAYLDHSGADLVVTQAGVDDLLLSQAAVPAGSADEVRMLPGVRDVAPILAVNGVLDGHGAPLPVFVVGYRAGHGGGPWRLSAGRAPAAGDEVALDRALALTNGIQLGDPVVLLGHRLQVVGISADTNAAGVFFAFVPLETAQAIAGAPVVSDLLVRITEGARRADVAAEADHLRGLHALGRETVAANDRRMVDAGFAQPAEIMVGICLVVGLLIAGTALYTATVEHARDFAVLKAVGAGGRVLVAVAAAQALALSLGGYALGWLLASLLVLGFRAWRPVIDSFLDPDLVVAVLGLFVLVNLAALPLPLRFVRQVDPQEVFKA